MTYRLRHPFLYICLLVLISSLFAWGQPAYAQNAGDIKLSARVGFDGNCKDDAWIPIRVTVENSGPDVDARVQVAHDNSNGNGQTTYGAELSLPTASRKELFLYVFPQNYLGRLTLELTAGGRTLATRQLTLTCVSGENLLIGLLSERLSADKLAGITPQNGFARVAALQLGDLPDRAQGWAGLDALMVSGADMGAISDGQRAALKSWLAQGGRLLVTGGPNWQGAASGLSELLPLVPQTTQTVSDLSGLQSYAQASQTFDGQPAILANGKLRPDADVLVAQDGVPLLAQRPYGFGAVYYLAADPSLQPLSDWGGMTALYTHLLAARASHPAWLSANWEAYPANQALAAIEALGLPPALSIFCLLGVYILVVGPLNYLVLRRLKRQELAWITIPVLVILFTLAGYFSGFLLRGMRPVLNRLAIVQAWDGLDQAQAHALVGVYSPIRASYTLQPGDSFLPFPFEGSSSDLQANRDWLALQQGAGVVLPDVLVESSGVKAVFMDGSLPALPFTHNLIVAVSQSNPTISGTITNASAYTLQDAYLVTPGHSSSLGALAPGDKRQVQMTLRADPQGAQYYNQITQSYYSGYGNANVADKEIRRSALMSAIRPSGRQNVGKVEAGIYLIGWLDNAVLPSNLRTQSFDSVDTTLYVMMLRPDFTFASGPLSISPDLFTWESSEPGFSPYLPDYWQKSSATNGSILDFRVAAPVHYRAVQSLALTLNQSNYGNSPAPNARIFLWDWEHAAWDRVQSLGWGKNNLADPARYVAPGGAIRLKMEQNQNSNLGPPSTEIQSFYLSLVVEP